MKIALSDTWHSKVGFAGLARLAAKTEDCLFDDIEIDMGAVTWFDADMCAADIF